MSAKIQTSMAEQVSQGDRLLTENLYVAVTPEVKQGIVAYARSRRMRSWGTSSKRLSRRCARR
jgi:hypothetical protein